MDFYCPRARLGIEIEGGIHRTKKIYDAYRERYLIAFKIKIIKFTNEEIETHLEKVLEKIKLFISSPRELEKES